MLPPSNCGRPLTPGPSPQWVLGLTPSHPLGRGEKKESSSYPLNLARRILEAGQIGQRGEGLIPSLARLARRATVIFSARCLLFFL